MKVIKSSRSPFLKVRLTKEQVKTLRDALNCHHRPIQYAGGMMCAQGSGWYEVSTNRMKEDWATDAQMMKALIKKAREILYPQCREVAVDYSKANVGKRFIDAGIPIPVAHLPGMTIQEATIEYVEAPKATVAPTKLEALQRRVNNKYHGR